MGALACETMSKVELPIVELSGLNLAQPDGKFWAAARAKMAWALENYGGFEAVYDRVGPQLKDGLLGRAIPEFFNAPGLTRLCNPAIPYHGLYFRKEGFPYLSLQMEDSNSITKIQEYSNIVWPEGNDFFCNIVRNYADHMQELMQIIHKMILESLGLNDHYDSHMKSLTYSMRLSKYNDDISVKKSDVVLPAHRDTNFISIISQHEIDGLEVESSDDQWIRIAPKPNAFVVLLGEAFMAWSNGRFRAPKHHVRMEGTEKRYSMVYCTIPCKRESTVKTPEVLVDDDHQSLFKPFNYYDYLKFRFSPEGETHDDTLKAYFQVLPQQMLDEIAV